MMSKKQEENIIQTTTIEDVMDDIIKMPGLYKEKLSVFILILCDQNKELYERTIDLLLTIEKFEKKLQEYEKRNK